MGEYIYASFECGGKIKREHAKGLVDWANHYGLSVDGAGGPVTVADIGEAWSDDQINYGNLDELVGYCDEHDIDYDYYHAEGPGWDAHRTKRIGGVTVEFDQGESGAVIPVDDLVKLDALATGWADLHERIRLWARKLPDVEWVGGKPDA